VVKAGEVVSSVWLGIYCTGLVDTRTLAHRPRALALVPAPCPGAGNQAPALVPNPETGPLI
jgi:hypothetical protein